jgi:hypothetical protein
MVSRGVNFSFQPELYSRRFPRSAVWILFESTYRSDRDKGAVTILIGGPPWREICQCAALLSASFPYRTRCTWFQGSGDSMRLSGSSPIGARVSQFSVCVLGRALEGVFV